MAALETGELEFILLRDIVEATDGNLSAHLAALEKAGYVVTEKSFIGRKPRTRISRTRAGHEAFTAHACYLRSLLNVGRR